MAEITEDDIRMFLVDRTADDNFLLDDTDFESAQIAHAMDMALQKYNAMTPIIHILSELPKYVWIIGTAAMLLRMKAFNQVRNRLDYQQKSGAAIQDKNKAQEYLSLSRELMGEFDQACKTLKVAANIDSGYGRLESPYRHPGTW